MPGNAMQELGIVSPDSFGSFGKEPTPGKTWIASRCVSPPTRAATMEADPFPFWGTLPPPFVTFLWISKRWLPSRRTFEVSFVRAVSATEPTLPAKLCLRILKPTLPPKPCSSTPLVTQRGQ